MNVPALRSLPPTQPCATACTPQDQPYAEWVGVRARVALLEAHAHCAVLAGAAGDPEGATARIVRQAQAPHRRLLLDGWLG